MINQERGHIVTISSMLGMMSLKGATSYCSSKFATTGMSEALFLELQEYPNIHLTSIHSYQVANDMFKGLELRFENISCVIHYTVNSVIFYALISLKL